MGLGLIFMYTHSSLVAQKTGMMARIMTTAAVYQKVQKISMGISVNEHVSITHAGTGVGSRIDQQDIVRSRYQYRIQRCSKV